MLQFIAFIRDERGATSIEYAVMASMIGLVVIGAVNGLGTKLKAGYVMVADLF
jgi:pilus assembly protein Flp/PilA